MVKNKLQKVRERGFLLSTLEKEIIPTGIRIYDNGHIAVETRLWHEYWQSVHALDCRKVDEILDRLHIAWQDYIQCKFNILSRKTYCYRYFQLLESLLSLREEFTDRSWLNSIQAALGFECFRITSAVDSKALAAGTTTLRNPCYLLAKLKMPDALDDPQFLPVITIPDIEKPEYFYHYRQYAISNDSSMSLLLYPAASEHKRIASFKLTNILIGGMRNIIDPRSKERAHHLCKHIIIPLMAAQGFNTVSTSNLELVDIGAGSGSLSVAICQEIKSMGFKHKLRLWFVDLELADPARFFRNNKTLRAFTDNLNYTGIDYRNWLIQPRPMPDKNGLRIALISKLFNNCSNFIIHNLANEQLSLILENMPAPAQMDQYDPSFCLSPEGPGAHALAISPKRIKLHEGRTFPLLSLSGFYKGLYLLLIKAGCCQPINNDVFLPVRTFNPACLVTTEGTSVLSVLASNCDYIIIEDADLRPQDLIDHFNEYSLETLTAFDLTKALGLKGNYLYTIWTRKSIDPQLAGERIW